MSVDSKRLRLLKIITKYLETEVTVANGYKHTLESVVRGRGFVTDDDGLPCVSILEALNPDRAPPIAGADSSARVVSAESWTLLMQGWTKDDPKHPCDNAYELMADVKKALSKAFDDTQVLGDTPLLLEMSPGDSVKVYSFGGLAAELRIEAGTVRPPEHPTDKAFFWMRVILKFTEVVKDPYRY